MTRSDELWSARAVREAEPPECSECGEPVPHVEHEEHGGFCLTCAAMHGDAGAIHELAAGAADAELDAAREITAAELARAEVIR